MWFEWLIQFGPITLFFIVFELTGENFFIATMVLMGAMLMSILAELVHTKRLALFPIFSASFTLFFGGATLHFQDPQFLMMKDTIYDAVFGLLLALSIIYGKNILQAFFGSLFAMSERGWRTLSIRWSIFFFLSAFANEIARWNLSPEGWVKFKILATLTLVCFGLYQITLMHRERLPTLSNSLGLRIKK